jgi:actin related protein 2/3 complex subunit 3
MVKQGEDVIDEALTYYRANVLFRNYELQGGADRIIIYLTLYISACLARLAQVADVKSGEKVLQAYAWESFALPGAWTCADALVCVYACVRVRKCA